MKLESSLPTSRVVSCIYNLFNAESLIRKMNMKYLSLFLLTSLYLCSCKKDSDPIIDYCGDEITEFKEYTVFEGEISFCNAQGPLMSFIPAVATSAFIDSNTVQFHLRADSIDFDTILIYDFHCFTLEDVIPSIEFTGETVNDIGYYKNSNFYNDYTAYIFIKFGYANCLSNTAFDGLSE